MSDKSVQSTCFGLSNITENLTKNVNEGRCSFNPKTNWINIEVDPKNNIKVNKNFRKENEENRLISWKSSLVSKSRYKNKDLFSILRTPNSDLNNKFTLIKKNSKVEEPSTSRSTIKKNQIWKKIYGSITERNKNPIKVL